MATGEELDSIAAEYALGVLSLEDRQAVERRMLDNPELRRRVADWQERLAPLAEDAPELMPHPETWARLRRSVAGRQGPGQRPARQAGWQRSLGFWRGWAVAATAAAAALAVLVWISLPGPAMLVAVLNDPSGQPVWVIRTSGDDSGLLARGLAPSADADRVPELWLLPGDAAPISLGLLDAVGSTSRSLPPEAAARLAAGAALAVSLEPPGGSPTGAPTGPVVSTGVLVREPRRTP